MKENPKTEFVQIRISKQEKEEMKQHAKRQGFDSIAGFLLWLFRKFGKN